MTSVCCVPYRIFRQFSPQQLRAWDTQDQTQRDKVLADTFTLSRYGILGLVYFLSAMLCPDAEVESGNDDDAE